MSEKINLVWFYKYQSCKSSITMKFKKYLISKLTKFQYSICNKHDCVQICYQVHKFSVLSSAKDAACFFAYLYILLIPSCKIQGYSSAILQAITESRVNVLSSIFQQGQMVQIVLVEVVLGTELFHHVLQLHCCLFSLFLNVFSYYI